MNQQPLVSDVPVVAPKATRRRTSASTPALSIPAPLDPAQRLREALTPYLDLKGLQTLVAKGGNIREALLAPGDAPSEVHALLDAVAAVLQPTNRVQIKSPGGVAGLLMAEMGHLDQEEFRVLLLNSKNRVIKVVTVYRGTVDSATIRVCEVFKEAIRLNETHIICVHNHPSGECTPSPEDVLVTRQLVEAGILFDIPILDHVIVGQGRWLSMKERGLGFSK